MDLVRKGWVMGLRIRSSFVLLVLALVAGMVVPRASAGGLDTSAFKLKGDAQVIGNAIYVTSSVPDQAGAAWTTRKNVAKPWIAEFTIDIDGTADGMAFVIQDDRRGAVGDSGGSLGYGGIPRSLAVEFDEYENTENSDPASDHVSVHTRGQKRNTANEDVALSPGAEAATIADGNPHNVQVAYADKTLAVTVDGNLELTVTVNLVRKLGLDDRRAYVGFTAGTGGETASHVVTAFSFAYGVV